MIPFRPHPGVVTGAAPLALTSRLLGGYPSASISTALCRLTARSVQSPRRSFHGFSGSLKLLHDQLQTRPEPQRAASTATPPSITTPPPASPSAPSDTASKPRRPRRLISAALFLLIGTIAGSSLRLLVSPPSPPLPGSEEDAYTTTVLASRAAKLPVVQSLASDPAWASWTAYSSIADADRPRRLTTGALAGSRGLGGYQRVFRNAATGECVTVAYVGAATSGWPGVVHGGLAATLLDEACGRCAAGVLDAGTGVTARLELNYRAPTLTNGFYVVRAAPELRDAEGAEGKEEKKKKSDKKIWVSARLETPEGKVCVEARGLFVVPKGFEVAKISEGF
ncbi:thioesterase family protein [Pleurostoma richardsiae]|uniref:Thioesterase family protein n=1 Tax=Pleurostoma richardsiae TaxID=41990 RepID=A0AA38RRX2_9PEZI|nr:thioesterase family protein [Pleurostoma richardsiae]